MNQLVKTRLQPSNKWHEEKLNLEDCLGLLDTEELELVNGLIILGCQLLGLSQHHYQVGGMVHTDTFNTVLHI
jgi:hypothetical protein